MLGRYPDDLNYVVKHFPLSNHKFAHQSAMAALAAGKQGQFWAFHSRLLENHQQLDEAKIQEIAEGLGLSMDQFNQDRQSPASRQLIHDDVQDGRKSGVRGTPSGFLNGKPVENKDICNLVELIDRA